MNSMCKTLRTFSKLIKLAWKYKYLPHLSISFQFQIPHSYSTKKYEFHVQPNIDAAQVVLNYAGQEKLSIDKKGMMEI